MTTDLRHALDHLENRGLTTPCQREHGDRWISEDPDEREWAAHCCRTCPVLRECAKAADENKERFGVWAGRDRTPTQRKKAS